jgi:hypothetical protein
MQQLNIVQRAIQLIGLAGRYYDGRSAFRLKSAWLFARVVKHETCNYQGHGDGQRR